MTTAKQPSEKTIYSVLKALASRGGKARAEALSAKRRREIATLGSRAAARAAKARRRRERKGGST